MSIKLKSFDQFVTEMDRAEEIEKDIMDMGTPDDKDFEEVDDEAEEVQGHGELDESEKVEKDRAEEIEDDIKDMGTVKSLAESLTEMYEGMCKEEAKAYEEDAHDEHTVESYMKENAALVASLMAKSLKEMKEEYATEAYEAACNEMIESYSKKMEEMKEMDSVADAEDVE